METKDEKISISKKWIIGVLLAALAIFGITQSDLFPESKPEPAPVNYVICPIMPDSVNDLTLQFKQFFDTLRNGTAENRLHIFFHPGKYLVDGDSTFNSIRNEAGRIRGAYGALTIFGKEYWVVRGDEAIFISKAPAVPFNPPSIGYSRRRHIFVDSSNHIALLNITFQGSNNIPGDSLKPGYPIFWQGPEDYSARNGAPGYKSYWEFEHAIAVHRSDSITIDGAHLSAVWGDGIYLGNQPNAPTTRVIIRNTTTSMTGRQGIALANAAHVLIDSVRVEYGRRSAIDFEPFSSDGFVRNVEVRNSYLQTTLTIFASVGNGDVSDIHIHGNTWATSGHSIICYDSKKITRRKNWLVENNQRLGAFGSPAANYQFQLVDSVVLRNNKDWLAHRRGGQAAYFINCTGIVLENNDWGEHLKPFYTVDGDSIFFRK